MRTRPRGRDHAQSISGQKSPSPWASNADRSDAAATQAPGKEAPERGSWPGWARVAVSVAILYHLAAVLAGALGVPPSSDLEQAIADRFTTYFDLMDLGYSYRFYAEPPPTPVVTATLVFGDGRPDEKVRLPGREVPGPRMRHQRQLALANALFSDVQEARRQANDARQSRLARAYARHLCRTHPGCRTVTLHVQQHLIPEPAQVREAVAKSAAKAFDLFGDRMFTVPEWIGDYPCDAF